MFKFLTRRKHPSASTQPLPRAPDGLRIYAVGDIHGRYDLLLQLQEQISVDAAEHPNKTKTVIYLGDYVDRGPDSHAVLEHLSTRPLLDFTAVFLKGNHEQAMLDFLREPGAHADWLAYGGLATLSAYGIRAAARDLEQIAQEFRLALPQHHYHFLERLEMYHVVGGYLFVHAGIRPAVSLEHQSPNDLLWIRDTFLSYRKPHTHCVVHGHSVTDEAEFRANRIGIDTGAFATGRLSCLVLDGETQTLLDTWHASP